VLACFLCFCFSYVVSDVITSEYSIDDCYETDITKVAHNAYVITVNKFGGC